MRPVLTVGLDGSPESLAAARWAADEAGRGTGPAARAPASRVVVALKLRDSSESLLDFAFHTAAAKGVPLPAVHGRRPQVDVADSIRFASPAKAVVQAAEGAALLVIGRRAHRPGLAPHLGPVAQAAIHHGRCPVAVVPHDS
ncbi:universal stress protein [Streptomyces afghaniensis]|uniref:universal stress protein n=1 Tax=Streptomyces afghaniensis TaxID=66865 RepID=UPI0027875EEA|nr:universal stress protein [Streptomyces afghaniensis]MDQ1013973.1 nucleotide-binding universal stress UspA family protein [Streptomyces afghaniensis]